MFHTSTRVGLHQGSYVLLNSRLLTVIECGLSLICSHLVVAHFWAQWAPQCQQMTDVMTELAKDTQYINVKFVKVCSSRAIMAAMASRKFYSPKNDQ